MKYVYGKCNTRGDHSRLIKVLKQAGVGHDIHIPIMQFLWDITIGLFYMCNVITPHHYFSDDTCATITHI